MRHGTHFLGRPASPRVGPVILLGWRADFVLWGPQRYSEPENETNVHEHYTDRQQNEDHKYSPLPHLPRPLPRRPLITHRLIIRVLVGPIQ